MADPATPLQAAQASHLTAREDGYVYLADSMLQLPPKEQAALHLLVSRAPQVVPKDEFAAQVWPRQAMSDESLARCIHSLRQLLRPVALQAGCELRIESLYGRGYRLAQVSVAQASSPAHQRLLSAAQAAPHLTEAVMFARQLFARRTPSALAQSCKILRATIQTAPHFAAARIALAECLAGINSWCIDIDTALLDEGLRHLEIAEQDTPNAPGLHSARAFLLDRAWRFAEAGVASQRALADNPHDPDTNFHYGWHLLATGEAEAACRALEQAIVLNPYSVLLRSTLARAYSHADQPDAALREAQAAHELAPDSVMAELLVVQMMAWQGQDVVDRARRLRAAPAAISLAASTLSYALARSGREQEALEVIATDSRSVHANAGLRAMHVAALLTLERQDETMNLMLGALDARCGVLPVILREPANAALRRHPKYADLHAQVFRELMPA
jgi:DNA-binding winged helix-turn-helix (wHTH) protein